MQLLYRVTIGFFLGMISLAGCVTKTPPHVYAPVSPSPPPQPLPQRTDADSLLLWASEERTFIVVDKGCGTVNLYQYGRLTKTYPAVFGRNPGRKIHEGDKRTPLGLYMIITKAHHSRWSHFLRIDYPNEHDRFQYRKNLEMGKISKGANGYPGLGGAIGIHGSDLEAFNRAKINWTLGCISLSNKDVKELASLVSIGTLVYIKD